MAHDNTFDLSESSSAWVIDWSHAASCEKRAFGQPYAEMVVDVYRNPEAPRPSGPEGAKVYANGSGTVLLKHASTGNTLIVFRVHVRHWTCVLSDGSRHRINEDTPFRCGAKRYTHHFEAQIKRSMAGYGMTIKKCSQITHTTPAIVKKINKERLLALAGDMMPLHRSRHIAVDEFLIQHGHRYCTIIIDADTGELLYLERGKRKEQLEHFFEWVGDGFMQGVEAVSMDMNTNYSAAFAAKYPYIDIVYDGFHIIKWFNDQVIDSLRRSEAKKLKAHADKLAEAGDLQGAADVEAERRLLFGARWNLLANERTLRAKDTRNAELNSEAKRQAEADGKDPAQVGRRRQNNEAARLALLDANASLGCAVRAREELQDIMQGIDPDVMREKLKAWVALYSKAGIGQLTRFTKTIVNRMNGIVSRATHRISSGIIEGTNTLVKNIRRQAFGLADFDYFGLLLWEQTHRPNARRRMTTPRPYRRTTTHNRRHLRQTIYRKDLRDKKKSEAITR